MLLVVIKNKEKRLIQKPYFKNWFILFVTNFSYIFSEFYGKTRSLQFKLKKLFWYLEIVITSLYRCGFRGAGCLCAPSLGHYLVDLLGIDRNMTKASPSKAAGGPSLMKISGFAYHSTVLMLISYFPLILEEKQKLF